MPQPIKKGQTIKKKGIGAWKTKMGLNPKEGETIKVSNANKVQEWILMPKAFQDVTKLPGIPQSTVISVIGHSNVGKSTLINHAIVNAQKQNIIPVIIDTENSFSFQYAKDMGFKAEPIYGDVEVEDVDEETGEITTHIENRIVQWDGDFIYFNNAILCDKFGDMDYSSGSKTKTKRKTAVIEDVALCINTILDAQDEGDIDQSLLFVWDSIGSIGSYKEFKAGKIGNAMWSAASISAAFNNIVNDRIPATKKVTSKYSNTFLYVNKVWMDSMTNPVGPAIMQTKGGKSMKYATRLEILMGGQLTAGVKRLTATSKGLNYGYGIQTKIKILKNHLDAPHNVCYEGNLIACDKGFIGVDELETYKKDHITQILKQLNELGKDKGVKVEASDVQFEEQDEDDI